MSEETVDLTSDAQDPLASRFRISDDAIFRELGDEGVVLDLANGTYFGLNTVGLRIWQLIEQFGSLGTVRDAIVDEFDVDADTAAHDVASLVGELSARGLVKASS
jgi:hypothetical protein